MFGCKTAYKIIEYLTTSPLSKKYILMKIFVLPSFYPDSSNPNLGSFFKEQVKTLAEFGIDVTVMYVEQKSLLKLNFRNIRNNCFQITTVEEVCWREYRIKGWSIPGRIGKKIWIYLSEKLIKKYITENGKPDLIHAHNVFYAGVVASNIMKKFKIPFIITEHSSAFLQQNYLSHKEQAIALQIYSKASKIIAVSKSLRKAIKDIGPKFEIDIIPNVVDTDFFISDKRKLYDDKTIKFIAIGNLDKNKGHDLLIDAFYEVSKINQNVILKICGDGSEKEKLHTKIQVLNLENRVKLTGHLSKSQILEKLQESDCLVHTSYFETFGVVLIEAMSCGIPFITTKCGGPEDIFEDGVGFMIQPGNVTLLAQTMIKFINQKNKFSKFEIRSIALNKYSPQAVFEKLMLAYSEILLKK